MDRRPWQVGVGVGRGQPPIAGHLVSAAEKVRHCETVLKFGADRVARTEAQSLLQGSDGLVRKSVYEQRQATHREGGRMTMPLRPGRRQSQESRQVLFQENLDDPGLVGPVPVGCQPAETRCGVVMLKSEVGNGPSPTLATTSPTAKGATRRWISLDDFVQEVSDARIYAGIHYRTATDIGAAMGRRIGELAVKRLNTPGQ